MPNRSSLAFNTEIKPLLLPANRTATATSAALDLRHADDVALVFVAGAPGDTFSGSVKAEFEVQETNDDPTGSPVWTAVANADLTYSEAGTNVGTAKVVDANGKASLGYKVGYKGSKRWIRVIDRRTGTQSTGTPTTIIALLGRLRVGPAA
ncbi:hypothetical protein TA3x_000459 [Tundrisphaera sp. TA3]|uniref:hypothetical protein n=1 Tax=Tundrisphaera sp. TA3 TaxID=3435775 RepID=UPI003EBE84E8